MRSNLRAVGLGVILCVEIAAQSSSGQRVGMVVPDGEAMAYWPRWRGPSGQGVAEGTGYPDRWSGTQNVLWRTPVPGRGHSSPIVVGGSHLPHNRLPRRARVGCRFSPIRRPALVGGLRSRSHAGAHPPEEQPCVGNADDRRSMGLCLVRQ